MAPGPAAPRQLVRVAVVDAADCPHGVLHRRGPKEPLPAREERAADDPVDRARPEREIVTMDADWPILGFLQLLPQAVAAAGRELEPAEQRREHDPFLGDVVERTREAEERHVPNAGLAPGRDGPRLPAPEHPRNDGKRELRPKA